MSIVENYKKLDMLMLKNRDDEIDGVFREILTEAFDLINEKIERKQNLDINHEKEKAALRAMFEYMLDLWAEGSIEEAKEVGFDMAYLADDIKLKEMFSMFVVGMMEGLSVDEFFEKYVNDEKVYKDYFFATFFDDIDRLAEKHKKRFQEEFSKDA